MKDCINCKNNCFEEYSDKCIQYTGPDFERFGIESGEFYDEVIVNLLNEIQNYVESKVDLSCIYTNTCDNCEPEVEVPKAVQIIIDKICSLKDSDIQYTGDTFCIGDDSISKGGFVLLGKNITYNVSPTINGSSVFYDLNSVKNSLPSDYKLSKVNVIISGKSKRGSSIILDSDKLVVGATIGNDRFPILMDVDIRVSTPTGDVKLVKSISIPSPLAGTYNTELNVKDFGQSDDKSHNLKTFLENIASQVCSNKSELYSYKNLDLPGCDFVTYNTKDIRDIISIQSSLICDLYTEINNLRSAIEGIKNTSTGNCN